MELKRPVKIAVNALCAAVILAVAGISIAETVRVGAAGAALRAGSWFSRALASLCGGFPKATAAVCVYFFYNGIFVASRAAIKKLAGTRDFTPLLITVAVIAAVFFPFRACIQSFSAALQFAFPIALALFATAFLIFSITENKHYIPSVILYLLSCGGHLYVAVGVTALLATVNFVTAFRRRSIVKTNIALGLAFACTVVNCFL